MLQLHLSDQHFYCLIRCAFIRGFVVFKDCFYRCLRVPPTSTPVKCLTFRSLVLCMYRTHCYVHAHEVYKQSQCCCQQSYICCHERFGLSMISSNPFQPLSDDSVITVSISLQNALRSASANKISFYKKTPVNHIVCLFQFMSGNAENLEYSKSINCKILHKIHI